MAAVALATALLCGVEGLAPSSAAAQCTPGANCFFVTPDGKGMVGLGLVGAELGLIIPAIAGVRDEWWPYLVFPLIGAAGGIVGGWAVEQNTRNDAEIDVALMIVGMALIVPTIVGTLALTAYQPPEDSHDAEEGPFDEDMPTDDEEGSVEAVHDGDESGGPEEAPADGAAAPTSSGPAASMRDMLAGGRGILRFDGARVLLAAPLPYSVSTYTAEERERLSLAPASDVVVPVVSATF